MQAAFNAAAARRIKPATVLEIQRASGSAISIQPFLYAEDAGQIVGYAVPINGQSATPGASKARSARPLFSVLAELKTAACPARHVPADWSAVADFFVVHGYGRAR